MINLVELVKTNWKAISLFIVTAIIAPYSLYGLYQDHIKQEETKSQIDSFLRNADSLLETTDYEDAIGEYKDVLKQISLQGNPVEYGRTQNNLGNAYYKFSDVQDKEENLNKAIQAFEEALKIFTIQNDPIDYAITQNNLGTTFNDLSGIRDKEENLNKAIQAFEEALKIRTIEKYPLDYATTKTALEASLRAANRTT